MDILELSLQVEGNSNQSRSMLPVVTTDQVIIVTGDDAGLSLAAPVISNAVAPVT